MSTTRPDPLDAATALAATARRGTTGLTLPQVAILRALVTHGPLRVTELAEDRGVRAPTATVAVQRLERLGLVVRSGDPRDLRVVRVAITPEGRSRCAAALVELGAGFDTPGAG